MWKYGDKTIRPGRPWTDSNGMQHPGNWNIWSKAEKDAKNIKEIIEDSPPDSRLYFWSQDSNGKITSTAKPLDDKEDGWKNDKDSDDWVSTRKGWTGIKTTLKNVVKDQQGSLLNQTDWAIIRKADKGTAIPSNIQTWRDAIRAKATEMENAIDNSTDTDAVARLFVSWDNEVEANSMGKFREAAAKTLDITILSKEEIEALTSEQKTVYDSDLEKITVEATSKRAIEINKYPILYAWPELGE
jgi:hypothetical protein